MDAWKVAREIVAVVEQKLARPNAASFVGKGKLEELQELVEQTEANLVIFDNDLTPAQGRNLEKLLGVKVIDEAALMAMLEASP